MEEAGAGWVVDSSQAEAFPAKVKEILEDPDEVERRGAAARRYADAHFTLEGFAARFDEVLREVLPLLQAVARRRATCCSTQA